VSGPTRLTEGGRHVDRSRPLRFRFDGRDLTGLAGDTVASALLANGRRVVARSYKYHRPRGVVGSGAEEPNALVEIGGGPFRTPNLRATEERLAEGMEVRSQNRWPSLALDAWEVNDRLSGLLPAGFYYKTFLWPRVAWKHVYEPAIRRAAGLGRAPDARDPDRYEHRHVETDVLVVGAGPAGLLAASLAAKAGLRVLLAEQTGWVGGRLLADDEEVDGMPGADWAELQAERLQAGSESVLLRQTVAFGVGDHGHVLLCQRGDRPGAPRFRLWMVRAGRVILSAGAVERPIPFANNDRPGVMLASAARDYVRRWGVKPGSAAVVFTTGDDGHETALALHHAGVAVRRIVDSRPEPDGRFTRRSRDAGLVVEAGSGVTAAHGRLGLVGVDVGSLRDSPRPPSRTERVDCDLLAVAGGWSPAAHLYCHAGGRLRWDPDAALFRPDPAFPPVDAEGEAAVLPAGAADGCLELPAVLRSAAAAAARAAAALGRELPQRELPTCATHAEAAPRRPMWLVAAPGKASSGRRHFVDYQHDVTVADLELAVREGYDLAELAKRYTTLGMAPDQGKLSNVIGHAIVADAARRPLDDRAVTTFRPPYTPITMGAFAGAETGELFHPLRATPVQSWHLANGADMEPVADWRRPYCYRQKGESREAAVEREVRAARSGVGIMDASTLGKILVQGPDAGLFLDRIYTGRISTLPVGRCRYGLMCNDAGFLFDDGVVARLAEDRFLCHTTSGGVERVHAWLEEWLQTEWFDLRVFVVNVSEQWAQFAVTGPKSRELLAALELGADLAPEALPPMAFADGALGETPARVFRICFAGGLGYEIAVPAGRGEALWQALLAAGAGMGVAAYGTEALHVMRAEQGYIMIGDETDGTVTPGDLGLGWAVAAEGDFLGKRGLRMPHLASPNRKQLVGLLTEDPDRVLPVGAAAVEAGAAGGKRILGHVTSSYNSPTCGRSIAMALIERGRARTGEVLQFPVGKESLPARVVKPAFLEAAGDV